VLISEALNAIVDVLHTLLSIYLCVPGLEHHVGPGVNSSAIFWSKLVSEFLIVLSL
jgi:hypothetical protein